MFFVNGAAYATWVARIPAIRDALGLRDWTLGVVLLFAGLGAIAAFRVAAKAVHRFGSRAVTGVFSLALCVLLPLVGCAPTTWLLALALFVAGFASGMMDVAMNENAVMVEKALARSVLSGIHGVFSAGGLVGALGGALAARAHLTPPAHFFLASAGLLLVAFVAGKYLLDPRQLPEVVRSPSKRTTSTSTTPTAASTDDARRAERRILLGLGAVAACSSVGEGAMADWTAVYLIDTLHATADVAALGFAAYSLAMLTGRFAGDRVTRVLGERRALRVSGMLVVSGLAVGLSTSIPLLFFVGIVATGLGLSGIIPISFAPRGACRTRLPAPRSPPSRRFLTADSSSDRRPSVSSPSTSRCVSRCSSSASWRS